MPPARNSDAITPPADAGSLASEGRVPIMEHAVSRRRRQYAEAVPGTVCTLPPS